MQHFFRVRFWQCIFENQKWRMWLKSKSIPKVNSSILNVFEPKFSIFAKQQYPSFSTSLQRNVATWGLWYANTFVDLFPTLMINILKRFVFASFNMCHWSFPAISRLKRIAVTTPVLFFDLISNELTFSHMTIVKGRKTCCWSF